MMKWSWTREAVGLFVAFSLVNCIIGWIEKYFALGFHAHYLSTTLPPRFVGLAWWRFLSAKNAFYVLYKFDKMANR